MYRAEDHTFAVCAYKESPFLRDCISSIKAQTVPSNIILCTSTPNTAITDMSIAEGIPLYEGNHSSGISRDWNYALECANTSLVTIAHQDDIYCEEYVEKMLETVNAHSNPLIFFSDYGELRDGEHVKSNAILDIKRKMLNPMLSVKKAGSVFWKRNILRFGSPICCPSVMYNLDKLALPVFQDDMKCSIDWETWESISKLEGSFCYCPEILMYHRIHEESETSKSIEADIRTHEDLEVLKRFWPAPIASLINHFYTKSQKSNEL